MLADTTVMAAILSMKDAGYRTSSERGVYAASACLSAQTSRFARTIRVLKRPKGRAPGRFADAPVARWPRSVEFDRRDGCATVTRGRFFDIRRSEFKVV